MKLAGCGLATVFVFAGCVSGTSLAGGDGEDEEDEAAPVDDADVEGADRDDAGDAASEIPGHDADGTPEIHGDAEVTEDARDVPSTCGNGILEFGEECDDGVENSDTRPDACRLSCIARTCGDGVLDTGERCDDGNRLDGDGCPASCFPDDEPPATLEGEPVVTDDPFDAAGPPRVAWNGTGWGIAWGGRGMDRFALLDADAHLLAPARALPFSGGVRALEWRDGEYGIAFIAGWPGGESAAALLDETGAVRAGPSWPPATGEGIDLAWVPALDAWVLAYMEADADGTGGEVVSAIAMDEHAGFLGGSVRVSWGPNDRGPIVASSAAGAVVAWNHDDQIEYRALPWPESGVEPPRRLLDGRARTDDWVSAVEYGTGVVFGWAWAYGGPVQVVRVDAWTLEATGEAATIGTGKTKLEFAAVPERGYLGVCWCIGPSDSSDSDRVEFRMFRPDGATIGSVITIRDGLRNAGACSVAWSGTEFIVVYWWCGGDAAWNTVYAQRVRPAV